MRLGTIQTLHKRFWQWVKVQTSHVSPRDGLCDPISRAAGELRPETRLRQSLDVVDYRSILVSESVKDQTLARLRCAHCQSLFNCEGLAQAVLAELRRNRIEYRRSDGNDPEVTDPEFIEIVRRGVDSFLRESFGVEHNNESCPPAA